jgi:uncharacterized protein (TIGR02266 family)
MRVSQAPIRRLSLAPDEQDEPFAAVDDEPRFSEERPTRLSHPSLPLIAPERRDSTRAPWIVDLEFGEDARFYTGLSLDISEGGIFVATYLDFAIGTKLQLCFELPDGTTVEARGEVRWRRTEEMDGERPGVGIAFLELPEAARERIAEICARQPPLYVDL